MRKKLILLLCLFFIFSFINVFAIIQIDSSSDFVDIYSSEETITSFDRSTGESPERQILVDGDYKSMCQLTYTLNSSNHICDCTEKICSGFQASAFLINKFITESTDTDNFQHTSNQPEKEFTIYVYGALPHEDNDKYFERLDDVFPYSLVAAYTSDGQLGLASPKTANGYEYRSYLDKCPENDCSKYKDYEYSFDPANGINRSKHGLVYPCVRNFIGVWETLNRSPGVTENNTKLFAENYPEFRKYDITSDYEKDWLMGTTKEAFRVDFCFEWDDDDDYTSQMLDRVEDGYSTEQINIFIAGCIENLEYDVPNMQIMRSAGIQFGDSEFVQMDRKIRHDYCVNMFKEGDDTLDRSISNLFNSYWQTTRTEGVCEEGVCSILTYDDDRYVIYELTYEGSLKDYYVGSVIFKIGPAPYGISGSGFMGLRVEQDEDGDGTFTRLILEGSDRLRVDFVDEEGREYVRITVPAFPTPDDDESPVYIPYKFLFYYGAGHIFVKYEALLTTMGLKDIDGSGDPPTRRTGYTRDDYYRGATEAEMRADLITNPLRD